MDIMNVFPAVGFFDIKDNTSLNKGLTEFLYSIRHEDGYKGLCSAGITNEFIKSR